MKMMLSILTITLVVLSGNIIYGYDQEELKRTLSLAELNQLQQSSFDEGKSIGERTQMGHFRKWGTVAGLGYLGYHGIRAGIDWWRGPVKVARNKIEHIKKLVDAELKTVQKNITHQENIMKKKLPQTTNPIITDLKEIKSVLDVVYLKLDRLLNPKNYTSTGQTKDI